MNKILGITGGIIAVIIIAIFLVAGQEAPPPEGGVVHTGPERYFEERMLTLGAADIGQPIEGFDANLLMMAFPGLRTSDFSGVETLEGSYSVAEGGMLDFVRRGSQSISTAERTVSAEGYATLLANLSVRLGIPAGDTASVDRIVSAVDTGEHIRTRIDEGGSALGVKVIPLLVLEDSRCPLDVTCIQAGTVRIRATLESGLGTASQVFVLGQPITTEAEEVTLTLVAPEPTSGETILPADYVFTFAVKKRTDNITE